MRFQLFTAFMLVAMLVSYVDCGCEKSNEKKDSSEEDGDVTQFFKNLGCDIKKGAEKISDTAKPWVDEIGKSAKKFGGTVADTFTDIKGKITGGSDNSTVSTTAGSSTPDLAPTPSSIDERILLDAEQKCPEGKLNDGRGHCRSIA